MHPFVYVLALAFFSMSLASSALQRSVERAADSQRVAAAGSIAILAKSAADYAKANPSFDGSISPANLNLPSWFNRDHRVAAYALAGKAYVYLPTANQDAAGQLARACPKGVRCTYVIDGVMYQPGVLAAFAAVPSGRGLPLNNAVMLRL